MRLQRRSIIQTWTLHEESDCPVKTYAFLLLIIRNAIYVALGSLVQGWLT